MSIDGFVHASHVRRFLSASVATIGLASLAGCSGAPSESDIKATLDKQVAAERRSLEGLVGKQAANASSDFGPKFDNVHKIGCKDDGDKAYRCDVELEVTMMGTKNKKVANMRFVKASDGWQVTN